jgi:hypothetical protein
MSDKIVENGKSTCKDSCKLDEKPDELIEEKVKVNEKEDSPVWGKSQKETSKYELRFFMVVPKNIESEDL